MTRLRLTVLTLSVVLFSLALGIALGGGPLQGPVRGTLQSQVESVTDDGLDEARLLRRNRALVQSARFDRGFAQAVSAGLLDDRLSGRTTVVLALPGVPRGVTDAVADDVDAAGGTVTTTLQVGRELVEPSARPLVDELSKRLLADLDGTEVAADASVYTRTGAVLSRALLTEYDGGYAMDDPARSVFNTLTTARLLRGPEPQQRASTAVVLLPEAAPRETTSGGRGLILTELVAAMDDAGDGVVVGGPPSSADRAGLLAAVRSSPVTADTVSTVDTVSVRAGQVTTVLALAEQADGSTGHYGVAHGADAVLPEDALAE
ncbi:MAG: copper transporter [Actinomycetota bacterium]|nr:copper transporter [Actinomycetota bacterium]